jgi:hypothetical protein
MVASSKSDLSNRQLLQAPKSVKQPLSSLSSNLAQSSRLATCECMSHRSTQLTMIILQLSHGLALISSCVDQREAISGKKLSNSRFNFLFSRKTLPSNLSWLQRAFSTSVTRKERPSRDASSLISESKSEMCRDDLPMRQRLVKSPLLCLGLSSSSEMEESSLEKLRSLRAAHAQDIIFWNFFFFLSLKQYFFLSSPLL